MIRKLILIALFLLALTGQGWGATYYVTEDGAGDNDGLSYANAESLSDFNGGSLGELDDDTVYICDTIRGLVTIPDGGTSGHPVTIRGDYADHAGIINGADLVTTWTADSTDLITDNWDDGDMSDWTEMVSNGTTSLDNGIYHSSSYSLKCDVTSADGYAIRYKSFTTTDDVTLEWWARISGLPSGNTSIIAYLMNSGTQLVQVIIAPSTGYLTVKYYDGASWQTLNASSNGISATTWTKLKLRAKRNSSAGIIQAWVSDNLVIDASGLDTGDSDYNVLRLSATQSIWTVWHDDINLDGSGTSNVWYAACATEPYWVVFDGTVGTYESSTEDLDQANEWAWTGGDLYVYSTSEPTNMEASKRNYCIYSNGADWIKISGLTAKYAQSIGDSTYGGIAIRDSSYPTVENCTVSYCLWNGISNHQSGDATINGNTVSYCSNPRGTGYGCGIRVSADSVESDNPTVTDNIVHHTYRQDGIRLEHIGAGTIDGAYVARNTSYYNRESGIELHYTATSIVEKNKTYENGQNCTAGASGISLWYGGASNTIRYNLSYDNKEFAAYDGNGIIVDLTTTGNQYIYGNICYGNDGPGVKICEASGCYVFNNSCYDNMQDSHSTHGSYPQHNAEISVLGSASDNNVVKNNIGYCTSSWYAIAVDDGAAPGGNILDTNGWYKASGDWWYYDSGGGSDLNTWNGKTGVGTDIFGDPVFVDKENGNLAISANSPCIDAGVDLGASYDDGLDPDSSWPSDVITLDQDLHGNGWDIGAFIYQTIWRWGETADD